jgi:hypothetical protein
LITNTPLLSNIGEEGIELHQQTLEIKFKVSRPISEIPGKCNNVKVHVLPQSTSVSIEFIVWKGKLQSSSSVIFKGGRGTRIL